MKILIDADKFEEILWEMFRASNSTDESNAFKRVIEELNKQPIANDWIPCSERVPENNDNVLVTTEHNDVMISYYQPNLHEWDGEEWEDEVYDKVIAWKPLPKPYKGE